MAMSGNRFFSLEEGWEILHKGINKVKNIVEGIPETPVSAEEYMVFYEVVYSMCLQKPPHDYSQQLYDGYRKTFQDYITSTVLPSLRDKNDELLLKELVKRWANHKVMVRWLFRFFHYLDMYFISRRYQPSLNAVGFNCFHELVYAQLKVQVRDTVISQITREREGEQIDRALMKNVVDIFV